MLKGVLTKEFKTYVCIKPASCLYIEDLFTIVKTWKQQKCLSVGEWINKLWHIQTMDYNSALKKMHYNTMNSHEGTLNVY